jgi:hypothetical protein
VAKKTAKRSVKKSPATKPAAKKLAKAPPAKEAAAKTPAKKALAKTPVKTFAVYAQVSPPTGLLPIPTLGAAAAAAPPPEGSAAAYAQYLPIAQETPASEIPTFRLDPALANQNVTTAMAALAPYTSTLAALPSPFSLTAMQAVPSIALATIYAAAQVDLASPGTTAALVKAASTLRGVMLSSAVTLMKAGVLPAPEVQRIMKGTGVADTAQDCVDLAQLFTTNAAAVAGKTPVTQAQIQQATQVGDALLKVLKPARTPSQPRHTTNPSVAARNALGALLTTQYEQQVRRAGMWIWLDDVDKHVPALGSHAGTKKKASPPKTVTATPTPTAAAGATGVATVAK